MKIHHQQLGQIMQTKVWLFSLSIFLLLAPFTPFLDQKITAYFYVSETHTFYNPFFFQLLYTWGERWGFFLSAIALILLLFSFVTGKLYPYRKALLAFLCTVVVGAGILTNALLKEFWGRPRPKQIEAFGGTLSYRPFYRPDLFPKEPMKSFPSGHVAIGFCTLSTMFSFARMHKKILTYFSLLSSLIVGAGLMVARVAQGGHFFSDVMAAFLLIFFVALFFDWLFFVSKKSFLLQRQD